MMKKIVLILILLTVFIGKNSMAQDFEWGKVSDDEVNMTKYAKDTSAHAVVLQEFGRSAITVGNDDKIELMHEYHVKIKIFDKTGFDKGTVKIPVYNDSDHDDYETVDDIDGVTYYKDDNGIVQKTGLEKKKIYPVKENKHWAYYTFALAGLRNGCVIEYKYRLESPYWWNMPTWDFQDDIPKVYSEYEVHIPGFWVFNASIRGYLKLTKNSADIEHACFSSGGASCDCSKLIYGMSDIPAFVAEDYMTSEKNYLSSLHFELVEFTNPYTGVKNRWTKEWKDLDYQLKESYAFGGQLKKRGLFKERIEPVIAGKTGDLERAKAVYAYIQKSFKWDDFRASESESISDAFNKHTGTVADINLALVNALSAAGLNAEPVLLSTRENGTVNNLYPVLNDFDYVIAKLNIGDKSYYLDATDPLLAFGMLPLRCLNDKGRAFSLDKPSYWVDLNNLQREKNTYALDVTLQSDGKITGTMVHYSIGYDAYEKRVAIKKFNSVDEYVDDLNGKLGNIKIIKSEVTNVDSLDAPVIEKYQIEGKLRSVGEGADRVAFNPYILDRRETNPFKLAERSYPVDWGMPSEDRFILTLHLPAEYSIESAPKDVSVSLPDNGGKLLTSLQQTDNAFTYSSAIIFNKSVYSSAEYPYLKEIYNQIISAERSEIIFKRK